MSKVIKPHQGHSTFYILHSGAFKRKLVESCENDFKVERIVVVYFAVMFDRNKQADFKHSESTDKIDFRVLAQIRFENSDKLVWVDH